MATTRSRSGDRSPSERRHVGLTLPRPVKQAAIDAGALLGWSAGDWVLAAAAEHGPALRAALGEVEVRKRPHVPDAVFAALYLTPDERDELDDQAVACGLNRSAFVTAVARLGLGDDLERVVAELRAPGPPPAVERGLDAPSTDGARPAPSTPLGPRSGEGSKDR